MKSNRPKKDAPDKNNSIAESIEVKTEPTDEPMEVKQEFGIKLEPEDDVDTIEYTPSLQFDKICIPKVEKVEPHDVNDEVVDQRHLIDQSDNFNSFNLHGRNGTDSKIQKRPIDYSRLSQSGKSSNRINETAKQGGKKLPVAGPSGIGNKPAQKKQHKCPECGYVAPAPSKLQIHMLKHTGEKPFPCKHCTKCFRSRQYFQLHLKTHVTKDSFGCSNCWQIFEMERESLDHELTCKKRRYECHLCKKCTTFDISMLKRHMRVHSGERPYKCDDCSMKFTQKSILNNHMKTHTNPRPVKFRCSVCLRCFLKQSEKYAHEMNCKCRRYECYLCQSYRTNKKSNIQTHVRFHHTGERPYTCSLCDKCYPFKRILNSHMKSSHKK